MSEFISISCPHCLTTNRVPRNRENDAPKCGRCHKLLFIGEPVELNDQWFNTFLKNNESPLLIDFWAPWCGPCIQMVPAFAASASQLEPGIRVGRINTEQNEQVAGRYNIRSIPTLILFDGYHEVSRHSGVMSTDAIVNWAKSNMQKLA